MKSWCLTWFSCVNSCLVCWVKTVWKHQYFREGLCHDVWAQSYWHFISLPHSVQLCKELTEKTNNGREIRGKSERTAALLVPHLFAPVKFNAVFYSSNNIITFFTILKLTFNRSFYSRHMVVISFFLFNFIGPALYPLSHLYFSSRLPVEQPWTFNYPKNFIDLYKRLI